jgi:hypothetical protein
MMQALPGASFVVNGVAQAHDSALTSASIEMKWLNGWSAATTFEGEFSKCHQQLCRKSQRALWLVNPVLRWAGLQEIRVAERTPSCARLVALPER